MTAQKIGNKLTAMGLLEYFRRTNYRKEIEKFSQLLRNGTDRENAEFLFVLYLTRNTVVFPEESERSRLLALGISAEHIENGSVRVYHYESGIESALLKLVQASATKPGLQAAYKLHFFSNLPLTVSGLEPAVRDMWDILFRGAPYMKELKEKNFSDGSWHDCRDVPFLEFVENPRLIIPHYMVTDSPAKRQIEERRRAGRSIGL